ncbi:hypothetical protein [Streptomyces violascens]|uniref:hypothetical protein n=1 Tax=Streptomyces violascens TaxID=67381 RepID=UPI00167549ED|nr:hypothetical protein [Streptomyces violascens]
MSHSSALQLDETRQALRHYRARAWRCVGGGAGSVAFAVVLAVVVRHPPGALVSILVALGVAMFGIGIGALSVAGRMRRALASAPWTAYRAVVVPRPRQAIAVVLADPERGELRPLAAVVTRLRHDAVGPGSDGVLWWCGAPGSPGVTMRPGSGELVWTTPIRSARLRDRLAGAATAEGVWTGPVPAPAPRADPGAPPARPGRRIGLFRWVVVAGAALFTLGAYAQTSSQDDPLVDLTVLSERPDGSCTVSWTDPLDSGLRTGPFHCDPNRDPSLKSRGAGGSSGGNGFEIGRVASHGLWKGRLYRPDEFGPDGAAYQVVVGGEYFGLPLAGAGLVAGAVSVIRRRRETLPVAAVVPRTARPLS